MGYAISWLAVRDKAAEFLLQELQLTPTGEIADYGESLFTGRTLPSSWFILFINQCEHKFVKPKVLASLSIHCEVIACSLEEHVMWCAAEVWQDGALVWRIEHDAQKSISHISTSGFLPDNYSAIKREFSELQQKQSTDEKLAADYFFEIPLQMVKNIVGFKHDEAAIEDGGFAVFKIAGQRAKPWWKLW